MKMKLVGFTVLTLSLSGCGALFDAAYIGNKYTKAEREKAGQVKFISESQGEKKCEYIKQLNQTGVDYNLANAINSAKIYLRLAAVKLDGNSIAITDKFVTRDKMTKNVQLTASIYKCQ